MSFIHLKRLLMDSLRKSGIYHQVASAMVLEEYAKAVQEIFPQYLCKRVRPMYVKDGAIMVACLSPIIAQELKLREQEILEKINSGHKKPLIQKVRYLA